MNNDISQEAKQALADNSRRKAIARLERDGAHSAAAFQRRVRSLAAERSILPADIHKLMYKRPSTGAVMAFCKKHEVSYDWLLCGDLRGLQRMSQKTFAKQPEITEAERKEALSLYCSLSARNRTAVLGCMRELMKMGLSNG